MSCFTMPTQDKQPGEGDMHLQDAYWHPPLRPQSAIADDDGYMGKSTTYQPLLPGGNRIARRA